MTQTLEQLSAAATQGEWSYRPLEHDDWGIIRGEEVDLWEWKSRPIIAQFRGRQDEKELSEHRLNKTDPWGVDAKFVVALVNAYRTGQLVEVQADDATAERVDATNPAPYRCKHSCERDALKDLNYAQEAEIDRLRMELQNIAETTDDEITSREAFIALSEGPKP